MDINPTGPAISTIRVIRPELKWGLGDNTQKRNMLIALEEAQGDVIAVIEDDDYYAPHYLQLMIQELQKGFVMVGIANAPYYNLMYRRFRNLKNRSFAPLGMTVFKRSAIDTLKNVLATRDTKFDVYLWKNLTAPRQLIPAAGNPENQLPLAVGMKGLPGRPGLGIGHSCEDAGWSQDRPDFATLGIWTGNDSQEYKDLWIRLNSEDRSLGN